MNIKNLYSLVFAFTTGLMLIPAIQVLAQPVNDNCANATTLSINASCTNGVTNAATVQAGPELTACLGASIDQTVWYKFVATATDMDVIIIGNSANKNYFGSAVWDPTVSPCPVTAGAPLACEDMTGGPLSHKHELVGLVVGNNYLVQIGYDQGGANGTSVSFCIGVYDNEVSSDDCANAVNVSTYTSYTVTNAEATPDGDLCSGSTENNIWFKWVVPSWWAPPGALAYVHLYGQNCDNSAGMQLSIFKKDNCGQIPNPATGGSPPGSYGDCVYWANTQTTNDIQYSWAATAGDIFYFDLDGYAGTSCLFTFLVSPYSCFTATATTTTAAPCPPATGGTATVTPSGVNSPFTYLWDNGQTTQTATGLTANATYYVTVTDAVSCAVVTSATVPGPAVAGFTTSGSFCTVGTGGTGVIFTNTGTSPADAYSWTFPSGTPPTSTSENPTVTWAAAGPYTITQIVTKDGCPQTSTQNVTILDCTCPLTVNAGTDIVVCDNTTTSLNGSFLNATGGTTYLINDNMEYANQAAFEADWTVFEGNASTTINLSPVQSSSPTNSIFFNDQSNNLTTGYCYMYKPFTAQFATFTVEFNIYITNNEQGFVFLSNGDGHSTANTRGPNFLWDISQNAWGYVEGTSAYSIGGSAPPMNQWVNVRFEVNVATDLYDIYIDGVLRKANTPFRYAQGQLNRIYCFTAGNNKPVFYIDDVKVYYNNVTILWTPGTYLSSTSVLNPTFTPPIVASPTNYTYTLCIVDGCSGACPNSKVDQVTITVNHCCNLTVDAGPAQSFNMCTTPNVAMAGSYANEYFTPVNSYLVNDNMEYVDDAAFHASWAVAEGTGSLADPSTAQFVSATKSIFLFDNDDFMGNVTITKNFAAQAGAITGEFYIFLIDGDYVRMWFGDGAFLGPALQWFSGTLSYNNAGTYTPISTYSYNTWYHIKMVANASTDKFDLYVDDMNNPIGTTLNFGGVLSNISYIEFITLTNVFCNPGYYVDDVKVYTTAPGVGPVTVLWTAGALNPGYPATGLSSTSILTPTFTPSAAGSYQFTLTVTDDCGPATDDVLHTVTSNVCTPGFSVNLATQLLAGNVFDFLNTGSTGAGWTYSWDMGGAGSYTGGTSSTSENPSFTYSAAGNYTVTQTLTYPAAGSCLLTTCNTTMAVSVILVCDNSCSAGFTVNNPTQILSSNIFNYTNTGSTGAGWTYSWDMGGAGSYQGGTNAGSENPSFTYSALGSYTVTQTVTNPPVAGCAPTSCTSTMEVSVIPACNNANRKYYRSKQTGNWNVYTTWQFSCDAGVTDPWQDVPSGDATLLPDYTKQSIVIRSGHTVTITTDVIIDETTIDVGGTLIYNTGILGVNNGFGTDLIINGTFEDNGPNDIRW